MKALITAIVAAALIALPATCHAVTIRDMAGNTIQPYSDWATNSRMPTPSSVVTLKIDASPIDDCQSANVGACYDRTNSIIYITTQAQGRYGSFLHELGHAFDALKLNDSDRQSFLSIMRMHEDWNAQTLEPPIERFADAYRLCSKYGMHPSDKILAAIGSGKIWTIYNYRPRPKQYEAVCALISSAGAR